MAWKKITKKDFVFEKSIINMPLKICIRVLENEVDLYGAKHPFYIMNTKVLVVCCS